MSQGNNIKKEDVVKELTDYDGTNYVTVFHIKKTNWKDCTPKELHRIEMGRIFVARHRNDEFSAFEVDNMDEELGELESNRNVEEAQTATEDAVREDFQDTWLFEEFEVPDGTLTKQFMTPESKTSWIVSSFSMNEYHGLAIGPQKEIIID